MQSVLFSSRLFHSSFRTIALLLPTIPELFALCFVFCVHRFRMNEWKKFKVIAEKQKKISYFSIYLTLAIYNHRLAVPGHPQYQYEAAAQTTSTLSAKKYFIRLRVTKERKSAATYFIFIIHLNFQKGIRFT